MPAKPKPTPDDLRARALWLRVQLDALPRNYDPEASSMINEALRRKHRGRVELLEQALVTRDPFPARISHHGATLALSMMGLSVTCTSGLVGACRNWLTRAAALHTNAREGMPDP